MIPLNLPPLQQRKWKEELKLACKNSNDLLQCLGLLEKLPDHLKKKIQHGADFPLLAPRSYLQRIKQGNFDDPLLRQILPLNDERIPVENYVLDPLQEQQAQLQPGLIQKYHGRALVIVTGACAIHCRYCFRRHFPYHAGSAQISKNWHSILDYLRTADELHEIILSGGDPLMLDTKKLQILGKDIEKISHIKTLRIHTRLPIVLPERITDALCHWLKHINLNVVMVIHSNHPNEINDDVATALSKIRETGTTLLNQTVLLKGVNNNSHVLEELSWKLFNTKVTPYYLHDLDPVAGAHHFSISYAQKKSLLHTLHSRLPGYLVPKFVQELPGESYKTMALQLHQPPSA